MDDEQFLYYNNRLSVRLSVSLSVGIDPTVHQVVLLTPLAFSFHSNYCIRFCERTPPQRVEYEKDLVLNHVYSTRKTECTDIYYLVIYFLKCTGRINAYALRILQQQITRYWYTCILYNDRIVLAKFESFIGFVLILTCFSLQSQLLQGVPQLSLPQIKFVDKNVLSNAFRQIMLW